MGNNEMFIDLKDLPEDLKQLYVPMSEAKERLNNALKFEAENLKQLVYNAMEVFHE